MQAFTELFTALDETVHADEKLAALDAYFSSVDPADAVWALYLLLGGKTSRHVSTKDLDRWSELEAGLPAWLFAEARDAAGDAAEAAALLVPGGSEPSDRPLRHWMTARLPRLSDLAAPGRYAAVSDAWKELDFRQRYVFNKLITGTFHTSVSRVLLVRALGDITGLDTSVLAHRLSLAWEPNVDTYSLLFSPDTSDAKKSRPYPFAAERLVDRAPEGSLEAWFLDWRWSGRRAQVIHRGGRTFVWADDGTLVSERFPEVRDSALALPPGTVLEGLLVAWDGDRDQPRGLPDRKRRRSSVSVKLLREAPAAFIALDLLEIDHGDVRAETLAARRARLDNILARNTLRIRASPRPEAATWDDLADLHATSRERSADGILLRRRRDSYRAGAHVVWMSDPMALRAMLVYVEAGRRGTEYTLALRGADGLVPIARITGGLPAHDEHLVDAFVREHTTERFGPVRSLAPGLVVEIAFDGVRTSARRKSGFVIRRPRIRRLLKECTTDDVDGLSDLEHLASRIDPARRSS